MDDLSPVSVAALPQIWPSPVMSVAFFIMVTNGGYHYISARCGLAC